METSRNSTGATGVGGPFLVSDLRIQGTCPDVILEVSADLPGNVEIGANAPDGKRGRGGASPCPQWEPRYNYLRAAPLPREVSGVSQQCPP